VHLVEDDIAEHAEVGPFRVDHVSEDFGRHHDDAGVAVDGIVAGEQSDLICSVQLAKVGELLVREGFERGRVIRLDVALEGQVDGIFRHHGLTGSGRGGHEH